MKTFKYWVIESCFAVSYCICKCTLDICYTVSKLSEILSCDIDIALR